MNSAKQTAPRLTRLAATCALALAAFALAHAAHAASRSITLDAAGVTPDGVTTPEPAAEGRLLIANEPDAPRGLILEYDLSGVRQKITPLARIHLGGIEKPKVKRPGKSASAERGVIHIFAIDSAGRETLAGSAVLKVGLPAKPLHNPIDVTGAINAALASADASAKKLRLAVRIPGKPIDYEIYTIPSDPKPTLEIASAENWTDDWRERVAPLSAGPLVYRETCLALADSRNDEVTIPLLYPAKKITEVIALGTGQRLQEGRDWILRKGKLVLPRGTQAPVQLNAEFFLSPRKDKDGNVVDMIRSTIKLQEGGWYHERQFDVSYEPATRNWKWPAPVSTLDQLPRTKQLLQSNKPLGIVMFGDSISEGFNASKKDAIWPYAPIYGELVSRQLERVYGSKITFMNHARAGGTSLHATTQVDAHVAWFKPDLVLLAYGMNDRGDNRRPAYRENLEKIIDAVRARSPGTEFLVITPMINNPKQPTGLDPVKFIRDEALKIKKPGVAFADVTSAELALIERKDYLAMSGNGANHPNDFLMRVYAMRILEVLAP